MAYGKEFGEKNQNDIKEGTSSCRLEVKHRKSPMCFYATAWILVCFQGRRDEPTIHHQ